MSIAILVSVAGWDWCASRRDNSFSMLLVEYFIIQSFRFKELAGYLKNSFLLVAGCGCSDSLISRAHIGISVGFFICPFDIRL